MSKIAGISLAVMVIVFAAFTVIPGLALGEENISQKQGADNEPVQLEGDFSEAREEKFREKTEAKLERIEQLEEEGLLSEEEAEEFTSALEERVSWERGICPEDGPRNCEMKLELGQRLRDVDGENGFGRRHGGARWNSQ